MNIKTCISITLITLVGLLATGCPSTVRIIVDNRTDMDVFVQINESRPERVNAMDADTFGTLESSKGSYEIVVTTEKGDVLFSAVLTEEELEERENRITIATSEP